MKIILLGFIVMCSLKVQAKCDTTATEIYDYEITDVYGTDHSIESLRGIKIWIVILPSSKSTNDSNFLVRIDSVASANSNQVKTIAVPSFEDGYVSDSINTIVNWYRSILDSNILISQPTHTS